MGVPLVLAIHAEKDTVSSYEDMDMILEKIRYLGGTTQMVVVPEEQANVDTKKSTTYHGYFSFALTNPTSDMALYRPILAVLLDPQLQYRRVPPPPPVLSEEEMALRAMEADMAAIAAAAQ